MAKKKKEPNHLTITEDGDAQIVLGNKPLVPQEGPDEDDEPENGQQNEPEVFKLLTLDDAEPLPLVKTEPEVLEPTDEFMMETFGTLEQMGTDKLTENDTTTRPPIDVTRDELAEKIMAFPILDRGYKQRMVDALAENNEEVVKTLAVQMVTINGRDKDKLREQINEYFGQLDQTVSSDESE